MRVYLGGGYYKFPSKLLKISDSTILNNNGFITIDKQVGHIVRSVEKLIARNNKNQRKCPILGCVRGPFLPKKNQF